MNNCFHLNNIKLQYHQKKAITFIMNPKNHSILLFHSLGAGKTLASLAMANCLMTNYPGKNVLVITPASLTSTFSREAKRMKLTFEPTIESFDIFINREKKERRNCKNTIVIVDEVQGLNGETSVRFKRIFNCVKNAFKVILLSATPVKNKPEDITNQVSLLLGHDDNKRKIENTMIISDPVKRREQIRKILKCKVSYYNKANSSDTSDYPSVTVHVKKFTMTSEYYKEYYNIQENIKKDIPDIFKNTKNLTVFLNGVRRAVNISNIVSPKIIWIIEKIKQDMKDNKKVLVYSNWIDTGLNIIGKMLDLLDIKYSKVSGDMKREEKDESVLKYNKNKNNVILLSSSGGEGLSLKGTRTIIILEPHWNETKINQVIGRGIRYKSHSHLPESQRHVDVYHLLLEKPYRETDLSFPSADIFLYKLSKLKQQRIDDFYSILKDISIENDKSCN